MGAQNTANPDANKDAPFVNDAANGRNEPIYDLCCVMNGCLLS